MTVIKNYGTNISCSEDKLNLKEWPLKTMTPPPPSPHHTHRELKITGFHFCGARLAGFCQVELISNPLIILFVRYLILTFSTIISQLQRNVAVYIHTCIIVISHPAYITFNVVFISHLSTYKNTCIKRCFLDFLLMVVKKVWRKPVSQLHHSMKYWIRRMSHSTICSLDENH